MWDISNRNLITDEWKRLTIYRLILVCESVSAKYIRSKVRKRVSKDLVYILDELLNVTDDVNKDFYYDEIINAIIDTELAVKYGNRTFEKSLLIKSQVFFVLKAVHWIVHRSILKQVHPFPYGAVLHVQKQDLIALCFAGLTACSFSLLEKRQQVLWTRFDRPAFRRMLAE